MLRSKGIVLESLLPFSPLSAHDSNWARKASCIRHEQ